MPEFRWPRAKRDWAAIIAVAAVVLLVAALLVFHEPMTAGFIDFIVHLDQNLQLIIQQYGVLTYLILFLIVFIETGLVIFPFLPGDSLILVAGVFAGGGSLSVELLLILFISAAIIGDTVNYWIGYYLGPRAFREEKARLFKKEYLEAAKVFYDKHGKKTIVLARFIPIIRSFAPFVAGIGRMAYGSFIAYNVAGGIAWVSIFLFVGYFFGGLPLVKDNLSLIIIAVIVISLIPAAVKVLRRPRKRTGNNQVVEAN